MSKKPSFSAQMKPEHLNAVRMMGYALTLGDLDGWNGLSAVLTVQLDRKERAALAFAALKALDPETARMTADAALSKGGDVGAPLPPLVDPVDEAAFWADIAATEELDAYAVAIFNAMSVPRKRAFLNFAGRGAA